MINNKRILAIIPARGGSKGLPGKNIKEICGKPLIAWTIESAQKSRYLDTIYVSTDSKEIADVCEYYGVDVPELRPDYLAQDTSSSVDVIKYTLELLEKQNKFFDYFILLEPTSPMRKTRDIDDMIMLAVKNEDADGVISLGKVHTEHPTAVKKVHDNRIIRYFDDLPILSRRQLEDEAYFPYGVGYLVKVSVFKEKNLIYTNDIVPYFIERWQNYEIDDIYDFMCIETIMKEKMIYE